VPTAGARVQYQALKDLQPHSSRARYAINAAITWCQVLLLSAVAVRAADGYPPEPAPGDRVLTVTALASNGDSIVENR
jgi:hypothetical protein